MKWPAAVLLVCLLALRAHAQDSGVAFEVASVKPSQPGAPRGGGGVSPSGRFVAQGLSLGELIQGAYASPGTPLYRFQITGGPDWMDSARWDITANSPIPNATPAQTTAMIRALLADRFKLVVREETRDAPIYVLSLAKRDGQLGPKLRKSSFTCSDFGAPPPPADGTENRCEYRVGYGTLTAKGVTTGRLALSLANFYGIGRRVVDRTGLTGGYDMDMEWAPLTQFRQPGNLDPPADAAVRPVNGGPSIFVALREQLGLSLDSSRGPVPMIVIERAEQPSEN